MLSCNDVALRDVRNWFLFWFAFGLACVLAAWFGSDFKIFLQLFHIQAVN